MNQKTFRCPSEHELLQSIVDTTSDAIMSTNEEGVLVFWNSAAEKMFGYSPDEVIGKDWVATLIPDDIQKESKEVFASGTPIIPKYDSAVRSKARKKDGTVFDVELTISYLNSESEGFYTAIVRDITDTVAYEKQLKREKEYLERVIQSISDGFFVCDQKGYITRINKKAEEMIGYPLDEIIGRHVTEFIAKNHSPENFLRNLYKKGYINNYCSVWQRKDGTKWDIESSISLLTNNGDSIGAVSTIRDISDKVQIEKVKKKYHAKVFIMREQEKKRFSQDLHDALSPAAISVSAKLRFLEDALHKKEIDKAFTLIDDIENTHLQTLSDLRQIAIQLRPGTIDQLGLAITLNRECSEITKSTGINVKAKIHIDEDKIPEDIKIVVYRVVMEALGNIIKHADAESAEILIELLKTNTLHLHVRDNGKGFDFKNVLKREKNITLGVTGMIEHIEGINGTIKIDSNDQGTIIIANIPLGSGAQTN